MTTRKTERTRRRTRLLPGSLAAVLIAVVVPGTAWADPPRAIPANSTAADGKWQPAFDGDGCYPTPAISPTGVLATGLKNSGALNGQCRDKLVNANFGGASLAIKDGAFAHDLGLAKPSGIPFDPNA